MAAPGPGQQLVPILAGLYLKLRFPVAPFGLWKERENKVGILGQPPLFHTGQEDLSPVRIIFPWAGRERSVLIQMHSEECAYTGKPRIPFKLKLGRYPAGYPGCLAQVDSMNQLLFAEEGFSVREAYSGRLHGRSKVLE